MSDIGRYRLVFPRLWRHPGFGALKPTARELTLYLLTGPQTNRIGLFHFSVATAAEDLNVGVETLRERLADVQGTFGWLFDIDARVFYIPSWWRWNVPQNGNVLKGILKDLNEIRPCALSDGFAANLETLPPTLRETFVEGCRQRLGKPSPIQEPILVPIRTRTKPNRADESVQLPDDLKAIANDALNNADDNAEIELLIDTFQWLAQKRNPKPTREQAIAALNIAIAERRRSA